MSSDRERVPDQTPDLLVGMVQGDRPRREAEFAALISGRADAVFDPAREELERSAIRDFLQRHRAAHRLVGTACGREYLEKKIARLRFGAGRRSEGQDGEKGGSRDTSLWWCACCCRQSFLQLCLSP